MAVPSLPTDLSTGDVLTETWVDAARDVLEWFRDDRPLIRIDGTAVSVASGSAHVWDFSDGSGSFVDSPSTNIGSWTAGTSGNEEIIVPEAGYYMVTASLRIDPPTTTDTHIRLTVTDNGASTSVRNWVHESKANIAEDLILACSGVIHFGASDRLGIEIEQDSGFALNCICYISAHWIQA